MIGNLLDFGMNLQEAGDVSRFHYMGSQAIWRDPVTGVYMGATERRKDGCAMGY